MVEMVVLEIQAGSDPRKSREGKGITMYPWPTIHLNVYIFTFM